MKPIHDLEIKNLLKMALEAMDRAYAPYSNYKVGVCLKAESGAYYYAGTVETASFGASICAERAALVKAVYEGERSFEALAIATRDGFPVPCGICRQSFIEFCDPEMPVICGNASGDYKVYSLGELFPRPFTKGYLE